MSCLPIIVVATVLVHLEEMTGTTGKYHNLRTVPFHDGANEDVPPYRETRTG
ncbi:hypothetical protein [Candidatus Coxiella mudrowiae]|uniref:hypothetical protein n=1 Tax=Candidatus Coxiella mudrowiae TaxID=2054173 RepID=UPI0012FEBE33|nr:hypothetical protein [Candidatus Coxiella mudrowiae]